MHFVVNLYLIDIQLVIGMSHTRIHGTQLQDRPTLIIIDSSTSTIDKMLFSTKVSTG